MYQFFLPSFSLIASGKVNSVLHGVGVLRISISLLIFGPPSFQRKSLTHLFWIALNTFSDLANCSIQYPWVNILKASVQFFHLVHRRSYLTFLFVNCCVNAFSACLSDWPGCSGNSNISTTAHLNIPMLSFILISLQSKFGLQPQNLALFIISTCQYSHL